MTTILAALVAVLVGYTLGRTRPLHHARGRSGLRVLDRRDLPSVVWWIALHPAQTLAVEAERRRRAREARP